jgi:tRNA threonylcarbamoyl adenosine modification protein YeaZ
MEEAPGPGAGAVSVLAIDTASRTSAWVVRTEAGAVLEQREVPGGELDRLLPAALAGLLTDDVVAVVVLMGPGSYSGVRAGMAAALGIAQARHLPLHGIGNLVAIAVAAGSAAQRFSAVSDAGRGGVYIADFERTDAGIKQVSAVTRVDADAVDHMQPLFTTSPITGLAAEVLDPVVVLASSVPQALAEPPLEAAGLSAIHAENAGRQLHQGPTPAPPATAR